MESLKKNSLFGQLLRVVSSWKAVNRPLCQPRASRCLLPTLNPGSHRAAPQASSLRSRLPPAIRSQSSFASASQMLVRAFSAPC